jgi:hypothetical protein
MWIVIIRKEVGKLHSFVSPSIEVFYMVVLTCTCFVIF